MGYDMRWRERDASEIAAVEAAEKAFHAAAAERDALPKVEVGEFNADKAQELGDWDAHEAYDGRTERYRKAQDKVHAAYEALDAAKASYFRLNIFGMGKWRQVMFELGMVFEDDEHPEWPKGEESDDGNWWWPEYGITQEEYEQVKYPEFSQEAPPLSPEKLEAVSRYEAEVDRIRSWHGRMDTPGIPLHKFSSNDGWIVLPVECQAALMIWGRHVEEKGEEAMHNLLDNRAVNRGYWGRWLAYLNGAITHGGFEVH